MPVNLYYTQKVRGFQQENIKYSKESAEIRLKRTKHQCPYCGSTAVTAEPIRRRRIRGEPLGCCRQVMLELTIKNWRKSICKKLSRIRTAHIKAIGIDEIHIGNSFLPMM